MNRINIFLDMIPLGHRITIFLVKRPLFLFRVHGSHVFLRIFVSQLPKKKKHPKTPAICQSWNFSKSGWVHQLDAAGKLRTWGPVAYLFYEVTGKIHLQTNQHISIQHPLRWSIFAEWFEQLTNKCPPFQFRKGQGYYKSRLGGFFFIFIPTWGDEPIWLFI